MSRIIKIGENSKCKTVFVGGENPVAIQTMWKKPICSLDKREFCETQRGIEDLAKIGCDILRFAVPDEESAAALYALAKESPIPLVADIHFDWRLALACIKGGVQKVRINPGNIGGEKRVREVVKAAADNAVPLRIGVNAGSLPKDLAEGAAKKEISLSFALAEAAQREAEIFESLDFREYLVSMKASSAQETIDSNRIFAKKSDAPLHVGVTEAGPLIRAVAQSAFALFALLKEGAGATVRVSLSDSCENEVIAAKEILRVCGMRRGGVKIVSCPRCGREGFDVHSFLSRWQSRFESMERDITVAVMGCVVNGPGEARAADIGICGAGKDAVIFKKGEIIAKIRAEDADKRFEEELRSL